MDEEEKLLEELKLVVEEKHHAARALQVFHGGDTEEEKDDEEAGEQLETVRRGFCVRFSFFLRHPRPLFHANSSCWKHYRKVRGECQAGKSG